MLWASLLNPKFIISAVLIAGISYGGFKLFNYHVDTVNAAAEAARVEVIKEQLEFRQEREAEIRAASQIEIEKLEAQIKNQSDKVKKLERQLLIDHDLDRLLQSKPGLILTRVNNGTELYYEELKEITQ